MNQQPQMDEARAAVKQQLLRTLMQQAVDELAADSQEQIDQQIREIDIDLEPARDRIRGIIQAKAGTVRELSGQRVREILDAEAEAAWSGMDMDAIVAESLDAGTPEFVLSEDVSAHVIRQVQERMRKQVEAVVLEGSNQAMNEIDVSSAVNEAIASKVQEMSANMLHNGSKDREILVEEAVSSALTASGTIDEVSADVRKSLVQRIANRTLDGLGDPDRLSHEARALITFDHDDLIAATTILRTRIIQDIARRTARSLGNREELATDAELWISASDPDMEFAREAAKASLTQYVETELRNELRSPESIATTAAGLVVSRSQERVSEAVNVTRELLIQKISGLAEEHLNDTEVLAARAATAIPSEGHDIQRIVKATMALIVGEIVSEAEGRLLHVEKLSSEARTRMAESLPGVEQAADMLEGMLVSEVGKRAHERLAEVQQIADAARNNLDATTRIDAAHEAVLSAVYDEIARKVEQELSHADQARDEAFQRIDLRSEGIVNLVHALQENMLEVVAATTLDALGRIEESLPEAMGHVPEDAPELDMLASTLRDRIMATILADTVRSLGQRVEKSATGDDMELLRKAMAAVLDPEADEDAMSWTALSDMDEVASIENELVEKELVEDEPLKPWSISELFATGDGALSEAPELPKKTYPETGQPESIVTETPDLVDDTCMLLYVYGVLDVDALDPQEIQNIEGLVAGSHLQFHAWEDICALTSRVPASTYGNVELKNAMSDSAWTKEKVSRHAEILNALPGVDSLVPLPFGEVFETPVDLDDFLSERHDALRDALSRLSNRQEFSVRLHVDMHALREHYMASDARIDASLNDMTHGVAGFIRDELKLSAEAPDESQLATLIQNIVGNTHTRLLGVASEGLLKNVPGSPDATHRVVLNASYLVSEAKEAEFRATVNAIAAQYGSMGVEIQLSGPSVAYHFTHIEPSNAHAMYR